MDHPITIAGIVIPRSDPLFLSVLAVHVPAGLTCVVAGAVAMLSRKGRGKHTRAGLVYYRAITVVFLTMAALAAMRWSHDYHLFILGCLSFAAAFTGHRLFHRAGMWPIRGHIMGLGSSYIFLLVAFYVDNGPNLPLWRDLPRIAYWLLPTLTGVPIIAWAVFRHPLSPRRQGIGQRYRAHTAEADLERRCLRCLPLQNERTSTDPRVRVS